MKIFSTKYLKFYTVLFVVGFIFFGFNTNRVFADTQLFQETCGTNPTAALSSSTTATGGTWGAEVALFGSNSFTYNSGTTVCSATGTTALNVGLGHIISNVPTNSEYYVRATQIDAGNVSTTESQGILVNYIDADNYYACHYVDDPASGLFDVYITKNKTGANSTLASAAGVGASMTSGDNIECRIRYVGSTPTITITNITDSNEVYATATDSSSPLTETKKAGVFCGATDARSGDECQIAIDMDNITLVDVPPVVTLGDGTDGGNSTIGPDGSATEIDRFSLATNFSTDTVTGMTVTLAGNASAYTNIATVDVQTTGGVSKCSSSSWGSDNLVELTSCAISVTTTPTDYVVKITPKTHSNMPAVPGASYATTATVTAITITNTSTGTDTDSATITVDNASPGPVTSATATAGTELVDLAWTNPGDSDFSEVVVLRRAGSAVASTPVEGTQYSVGNTIGTATVACVTSSTSCQDTGLTGGTAYHYATYTKDSRGNYDDASVIPTGSPATPTAAAVTTAGTTGTQTANLSKNTTGQYVGGAFSFSANTAVNVTGITITESGTINGSTNLDNIKLYYENDTSSAYDCASESYGGGESQFGSTDTDGFSGANGTSAFSGTVGITATSTLCVYVVLDVASGATGGETIELSIAATTDFTVSAGTKSGTPSIAGTTTIRNHTTLGDGTDPSNSTIAPSASVTDIDKFTLVTDNSTDNITALTATLGVASSYNNISKVEITDDSNVDECDDIDSPASVTLNFTNCSLAVTTTPTTFKIRITPKTHSGMPAVPGASYATTATITALTGTNTSQTIGDTDSAVITVDNASPAAVTSATATAGIELVDLAWTNPGDSDFSEIVVLRRATSDVTDVPAEGGSYSIGNTIGTATVACVTSSTSCSDTSLSGGIAYYYKIFTKDTQGNYNAGTSPTGSPATPTTNNRYWVGGTGNWSDDDNHWATSSGGTPADGNIPSSTNNCIFDSSSSTTNAAYTVTVNNNFNCRNFTMDGPGGGNKVTWAGSSTLDIAGSFNLVGGTAGITRNFTGPINFTATSGTNTITTNGVSLDKINLNGAGGTWQLADSLVVDNQITLTRGSFDTNNNSVQSGYFSSSNTNTRSLSLGSTTWTFYNYDNTANWETSITTGLTFNAGTSTIQTNSIGGPSFHGGGLTFNNVIWTDRTTDPMNFKGSNTFANLTINGSAAKTGVVNLYNNQVVTGTLTIAGNSASNRLLVQSDTLSTARTLTAAAVSLINVDFMDITGAGAASPFTGTSLGDALGNSGITFTSPATQYWNTATSGTKTWSTAGNWFLATNGGGGAGRVPLPQDSVVFDASSIGAASTTITADMPRLGTNINFTGVTNTPTLSFASTTNTIYGSLTFASGMNLSGNQTLVFSPRSSINLTTAGKTLPVEITIDAPGGTVVLQDNFAINSTLRLKIDRGELNANNFNVSVGNVFSNNSNTRAITMGSGTWTLQSVGTTVWTIPTSTNLTFNAGSSTIKVTNTGNNITDFNGGGLSYNNLWFSRGASSSSFTITGSNTFNEFKDTGTAAHTIFFDPGSTQTISTFTVSGTAGNLVTINSGSGGGGSSTSTHALTLTGGGTVSSDYLNIQHSIAGPANTWYAGANSTNNQGVATAGSGWIFTAPPTVTAGTTGTQTANLGMSVADQHIGGAFSFSANASINVTGITITESGTINGSTNLDNIKLYYESDTSAPYDCASESYAGSESQYGSTDTDGFSGANGTSAFTATVGVSSTSTLCVYPVLDVTSGAAAGDTIEISIAATSDYTTSTGVKIGTPAISGTTTIRNSTTLADGTNPSNASLAPGGSVTDIDAFTLTTDAGSDTITALTVTLDAASSYSNLSKVEVTTNSNVDACTDIDNPASTTLNFTGCSLSVTTSPTTFKIRITPKTHANMPAVPGASYATTARITSLTTATNAILGTDAASATITVDNASPTSATVPLASTAGYQNTTLKLTTTSGETTNAVVLRWAASSIGAEVPVEGSSYTAGDAITTATVACVFSSQTTATALIKIDGTGGDSGCTTSALTNGQAYSYKVFSQDANGNYDAGTLINGSPLTPVGTSLGDGTDGASSTIAPGTSATEIDRFSLATSSGTDTVTGMTVTLAPAGAFNNLTTVGVYTTGDVLKCSSSSWGGDLTVELTSCAIAVTTTPTEYVVKITPFSHANMPAVPGASYATTATVTAITATNGTAGTDTDSATITVDNASPAGVTSSTAIGGDTVMNLAWTNPADSDFTTSGTVVVLRRASSAVASTPVEGTTYSVGNSIGTATVACVVTGSAPATSCQDTGLTNDSVYHYKIFTQDSRGNYDAGTVPTGSPATPSAKRYWVGGTADWDGTAGSKWSTTSGGTGGASLPTSSLDAIFDGNSGAVTVTIASGNTGVRDATFTGFTGTLAGSAAVSIYGSLTIASGMTNSYTGDITFAATSGTKTITSNGKTFGGNIIFDGVGGTWQLGDHITVDSAKSIALTNGTFDANGKNVSIGSFSANTGTKVLTMGSGTWTLTGSSIAVWSGDWTNTTLNKGSNPIIANYSGSTGTRNILGATALGMNNPDFNITAGSDTIALGSAGTVNFTGFSGNLTAASRTLFGGLTMSATMTMSSSIGATTFGATSGTHTITTNGVTLNTPITFNGVGGTWQLGDDFAMGSTRTMTLTNGTLSANDYNVNIGKFSSSSNNVRTLNMGSGIWTLTGTAIVWSMTTGQLNLTLNESTSTIKITDTSATSRTFQGAGETYYNFWSDAGGSTGSLTIGGSNTFHNFKDTGTAAHSILFEAGTTQTMPTFNVTGNGAGNEITINSTDTGTHALSITGGGLVDVDYLNIQHSVATPASTWYAGVNSTDNQATTTAGSGWIFTPAPCHFTTTGNWNTGSNWTYCHGVGGIPTTTDSVTIDASKTVTLDVATPVLNSLLISGTLNTSGTDYALNAKTINIDSTGSLTANGSTITLSGTSGTLFTKDASGTFNKGTSTVVFSGNGDATLNTGAVNFQNMTSSGTGTKTLGGDTTVSGNLVLSAGTLALSTSDFTVTGTSSITGTLNDASTTGTNLFTGAVTINAGGIWNNSGNDAFSFRGGLTNNSVAGFTSGTGVYTFETNAQTISGSQSFTITNLTNNITSGNGLTFSGANPTITTLTQGTNAVLTFSGTMPSITTLAATASGNTVRYTRNDGGNQTVKGTSYHNLTIDGLGIKTLGATTSLAGNLNIQGSTLELSSVDINVTGTTSITGLLIDSFASGGNIFNGTVTINNGGAWSVSDNSGFTFRGGLTNNSSSGFTSGTGVYEFSTNPQTIGGSQAFTITNLTNFIGSSSGLTFSGAQPSVGTLTQYDDAILTFSGTVPAITNLDADANNNTVKYTGGAQTIKSSGLSWSQIGNDTLVSSPGIPAMAALSESRIAFIESGNDQLAAYDFDGANWSQVGNGLSISINNATFAMAALSESRVVLIDPNSGELRAYDFDGTDWTQVGDGLSLSNSNAALAALSYRQVAFIDKSSNELRTYDFDGSNWTQEGNGLSVDINAPTLAALSSSRVAFIDDNNDELRAYDFDGTDWTQIGDGFNVNGISIPALAALSSSRVAFIDSGNDQLRTYDFDGAHWLEFNSGLDISSVEDLALAALSGSRVAFFNLGSTYLQTYRFDGTLYNNLIIDNTGTATLGDSIVVKNNLTISSGTLNASDSEITVSGNFENNGTFTSGTSTVIFDASDTNNTISGSSLVGSSKFHNIVFDNANGGWNFGSNDAEVGGNFTITSGAVVAPSTTLTIGGDFTNSPETEDSFVHNSGTVTFNTTGTSSIIGNTTFNGLTVATGGKKILFGAGDTFRTNGSLSLTGSSHSSKVEVDSTDGRSRWFLNQQGSGEGDPVISFVYLNNSGCHASSLDVTMSANSVDGSNNDYDCWKFPVVNRGGGGGNAGGEGSNGSGAGTCADGIQNGNETGIDQGGRCLGGGGSGGSGSGESGDGSGAGTCADGIQNGNETGIDQGGRCLGGGGSGGGGGDSGFLFDPAELAKSFFAFIFPSVRIF